MRTLSRLKTSREKTTISVAVLRREMSCLMSLRREVAEAEACTRTSNVANGRRVRAAFKLAAELGRDQTH